jgi:hypothetical protein
MRNTDFPVLGPQPLEGPTMQHVAKALSFAATAVLALSAAIPAHAMLVLQGPEDFQGTGLGSVNTILTLQSPGNSTFEAGSVERVVGRLSDFISGDAKTARPRLRLAASRSWR